MSTAAESSTRSHRVVVSDTDVLDCPICVKALTAPVFQCRNGHVLCQWCTSRVEKCPSCNDPVVDIRNLAIEKVIEATQVRCPNTQFSCTIKTTYGMQDHENSCLYAPCCLCPHEGCEYIASSNLLHQHFSTIHNTTQMFEFRLNHPTIIRFLKNMNWVVLKEVLIGTLFVLKRTQNSLGSIFSVVCLAPPSSGVRYSYMLEAKVRGTGEAISLTSSVVVTTKCSPEPPTRNFLLIPNDFHVRGEHIGLKLIRSLQKE